MTTRCGSRSLRCGLAWLVGAVVVTGCAVRPIPDPRNPGMVDDGPVTMRVCIVEGDGAHVYVGDQVQFMTNNRGRLRIRHLPGPNNDEGAWNDGEAVKVRSAVLVERAATGAAQQPQQQRTETVRRFVPVGRFDVRFGSPEQHAAFDFHASKTTTPTRQHEFRECIADVGDDEIVIRGVAHDDRHGGHVILRGP